MAVRMANCGSDENGRIHGGVAGDQTGGEWRLRTWYSYPWNYVIRWKNESLGNLFADLATQAANNNKIGYDQWQRDTFWTQLKKVGYYPSKITVACEADCSSGTVALIKAVGYLKGISELKNCNATYTGNMMEYFRSSAGKKYFEVLTGKHLTSSSVAKRGDINLNVANHVNITIDNGSNASSSSSSSSSNSTWTGSGTLNKSVKWNGSVTADSLSVRTWAGVNNSECSFSPLKYGTKVEVCDSEKANDGSTWYYIKYKNKYGFVHSSYIKKESSSSTTSSVKNSVDNAKSFSKSLAGTYRVSAKAGLNLRSGAGTNKKLICIIPYNGKVECYGYYTNVNGTKWYLVVYDNHTGYVSSQYIKK